MGHPRAVRALFLGEHALEKTRSLSLEHATHTIDLDIVAAESDENAPRGELDVHEKSPRIMRMNAKVLR
jgi:hypothetical protein